MAQQQLRDRIAQTRLTEREEERLGILGERMKRDHSDVVRLDGSINSSAVIRHLINEPFEGKRG